MTQTEEFCHKIGLTTSVRRWLSEHDGDPARDEIVFLLYEAIDNDLSPTYLQILRSKIAKIAP